MNIHYFLLFISLGVFLLFQPSSAISVKVPGKESFCFWKHFNANERYTGYYVISGYYEDRINLRVQEPETGALLYESKGTKEGYWEIFTEKTGEYSACFDNFASKENIISIEIYSGEEEIISFVTEDLLGGMNATLKEAFVSLKEISSNFNFQRTRETIHSNILDALSSRITWSLFFKVVVLIIIAGSQVFVLTGLFKSKGRRFV